MGSAAQDFRSIQWQVAVTSETWSKWLERRAPRWPAASAPILKLDAVNNDRDGDVHPDLVLAEATSEAEVQRIAADETSRTSNGVLLLPRSPDLGMITAAATLGSRWTTIVDDGENDSCQLATALAGAVRAGVYRELAQRWSSIAGDSLEATRFSSLPPSSTKPPEPLTLATMQAFHVSGVLGFWAKGCVKPAAHLEIARGTLTRIRDSLPEQLVPARLMNPPRRSASLSLVLISSSSDITQRAVSLIENAIRPHVSRLRLEVLSRATLLEKWVRRNGAPDIYVTPPDDEGLRSAEVLGGSPGATVLGGLLSRDTVDERMRCIEARMIPIPVTAPGPIACSTTARASIGELIHRQVYELLESRTRRHAYDVLEELRRLRLAPLPQQTGDYRIPLREYRRRAVAMVLRVCAGQESEAARILDVDVRTLRNLL